jgi:methyl-accepting chemotaxis protein
MRIHGLKTKAKILIGICSPLVLLLVLSGVSIYNIISIVSASKWVDHTRIVLAEAAIIATAAVDMETGMRGYLLAGRDDFLAPYEAGSANFYELIAGLRETVDDNPTQVARLNEIEQVLHEWQENVIEPTIALRREIGDAETMNDMADLVGEARGKAYFDKFRGQIVTFIERETVLMEERRAEFQTAQTAVREDFELAQHTVGWVDHTHEVLVRSARLLSFAVDMETGMRGYLLAGEDEFLDPYNNGKRAFFASVRSTTTRPRWRGSRRSRASSSNGSTR